VRHLIFKNSVIIVAAVGFLSACQPDSTTTGQQAVKTEAVKEQDKMGYALGAKMAGFIRTDISNDAFNINNASVAQGFSDELNNNSQMTAEEITKEFAAFQQKMQAYQQQKAAVAREKQVGEDKDLIAKGDAFIAENAKKEGVITTKSGLQYKVLTAAKKSGVKAKLTDTVKVHYTGSLIDGTVFDSSVERDPLLIPVNRVIPGWTEGLQLMDIGSKYQFVIPWKLAYGEQGRPGSIPRHAVLLFDVELIAINPEQEKK